MRPVHPAAWHGGDKMEMTEADLLRREFFDDHARIIIILLKCWPEQKPLSAVLI